ncbi:MAG: DUF2958 domain-containing protein [Candidatus Margulisiibacteriota bacterium]|nr:MAG: DUF2958 domain-containing protein [Candidatus Margulisiibacteriota bacterium]
MNTLTQQLSKLLPPLYSTENFLPDQVRVPVKLFNAYGVGTWYITEFDGKDIMFGFCNLGDDEMAELGYVSLKELQSLKVYGIIPAIEKDRFWDPQTTLHEVVTFKAR